MLITFLYTARSYLLSKYVFSSGQINLMRFSPCLQAVDIRQIADKFPEKRGGLKELYDKGPQAAFFLVKFWVSYVFYDIQLNFFKIKNALYNELCQIFTYLMAVCNIILLYVYRQSK